MIVLFFFLVDSLAFFLSVAPLVAPRKPPKNPDFASPVLQSVLRTRLVALGIMGTISARKRADGSTSYTAQIRLKE